MAISNEGCNRRTTISMDKFSACRNIYFLKFLCLDPSIEMAITPTFFDQFEKFQCLSSSTPQGLPRDIFRRHVARVHVPKNVS